MLLDTTIKGLTGIRANVTFRQDGVVVTDLWGNKSHYAIVDEKLVRTLHELRAKGNIGKAPIWEHLRELDPDTVSVRIPYATAPVPKPVSPADLEAKKKAEQKEKLVKIAERWLRFFTEFNFKPALRVVNAMANLKSVSEVRDFIVGFFALTNHSSANDIREKVKSPEFLELAADTCGTATHKVNDRLVIWYGDPGTGKTYTAIEQNPEAEVVGCHAAMTTDDLYRMFDFVEGKGTFKPSPLTNAMIEGKTIIFDEINLLSTDCLRALQEIADGKEIVNICGQNIHIKKGFRIIGTMNLYVDDQIWPLPRPLLDRAAEIKEFQITAEQLAELAF